MPNAKFYKFSSRVDTLINWLKKFHVDMTFFYLEQPDSVGHSFGPDSEEYYNMVTLTQLTVGT